MGWVTLQIIGGGAPSRVWFDAILIIQPCNCTWKGANGYHSEITLLGGHRIHCADVAAAVEVAVDEARRAVS